MKYLVLIQARCCSTRLSNKVLRKIVGKPILQHVIERAKLSKFVDEVMVVTSIERDNLKIVDLCVQTDTRVFIGSECDVLDRFYQAARLLQPEYVIRLTADCPLLDPGLIDEAISQLSPDTDYLGMISETFADGLDIEIMKYSALETSWEKAHLQSQREHVTQYILRNPNKFVLQDFVSPVGNFGNLRWTVDEEEDYELVMAIFNHFSDLNMQQFRYTDVIEYISKNPCLKDINSMYARNEGLTLSLKNDSLTEVKK